MGSDSLDEVHHAPAAGTLAVRLTPIFALFLVAFALSGYILGISQTNEEAKLSTTQAAAQKETISKGLPIPHSVPYGLLPQAELQTNFNFISHLDALVSPDRPTPNGRREDTLAYRERLRAFDGAPPVVPHPMHQTSSKVCLSCHEKGRWIDTVYARPMSHPNWASCTQCHVQGDTTNLTLSADSYFHGLRSQAGARYMKGTPPAIPHSRVQVEQTRVDCLSCHGKQAWPGLRFNLDNPAHQIPEKSLTNHEERGIINVRCQQCHVVADR